MLETDTERDPEITSYCSLFPRECGGDVRLMDSTYRGKPAIVNAWALGRDSNYWTEPERFIPERFLDCSIDYKGNNFEYIPFGAGRRIYPGLSFADAIYEALTGSVIVPF